MTKETDESKSVLNEEHLEGAVGGYYGVYSYTKGDAFRNGNNAFLVLEDCPLGERVRVTLCTHWEGELWIGSEVDRYLPNGYFEENGFEYIGNNVLKFR